MINPKLPDAFKAAAERVYADISTRIVRELDKWDWAIGKQQITALRTFLHKHLAVLGDRSFGLELSQEDDSAGRSLTPARIAQARRQGALISVGRNLRMLGTVVVGTVNSDQEHEFYSSHSRKKKTVVAFYEQRSVVVFYADGVTCGRIDPRIAGTRAGKAPPFARRPEHYKQAILDHYRKEVRDWNKTDHWANRAKRILRATLGRATRTEDIFLNALLNWFEINLGAHAHVRGKVGQVTTDETDIEVSALSGVYIIEIKWLGENENGTCYRIDRIAQGLRQVRDYLQKQSTAEATLLTYDGRDISEFENLTQVCEEPEEGCKMLKRCARETVHPYANCMVLFLENRTASEK